MSNSAFKPQIGVGKADNNGTACISAIVGNSNITHSYHPVLPLGEDIFINKNYTDFRPLIPEMNLLNPRFNGFKSRDQMNRSEINRRHQIHYEYKENRYGFETDINNYQIIDDQLVPIKPIPEKTDLERVQYAAQLNSESKLYIKKIIQIILLRKKEG